MAKAEVLKTGGGGCTHPHKEEVGYFRDGILFESKKAYAALRKMAGKIQRTKGWRSKDETRRRVGNIDSERRKNEEKNLWIAEQRRRAVALKQRKKEYKEKINSIKIKKKYGSQNTRISRNEQASNARVEKRTQSSGEPLRQTSVEVV